MAEKGEEQRDQLFGMNVGDGLIEVNTESEETVEKTTEETKKVEKPVETQAEAYEDGSFEINEFIEKTKESAETTAEETEEFIEKTEKSEETKETPSETGSSDSSSSSPFLAFARDRANEGVFLEFEDEDWETLKERNDGDEAAALRELSEISVQERIRIGIESYKESLSEEERMLYEAKEKGLPVDEYSIAKRNFDKYSKIDKESLAENEKLQEEIVSKALELRGFTPEEIKEEIDGYKALENLESKAEKLLPTLPKTFKTQMSEIEKGAEAAEQARQDAIRQRIARMKRTIDNTPEIIPGIQLNKNTKEKIMKSMTVPIAKDEQGNPLNPVMATRARNPEAFEMMLHYYHSLGLFNIDDSGQIKADFSKISKVEKTKATDSLRSAFEAKEKTVAGRAKLPEKQEDELDEFDRAFRRL
jgi:hypothetical protein